MNPATDTPPDARRGADENLALLAKPDPAKLLDEALHLLMAAEQAPTVTEEVRHLEASCHVISDIWFPMTHPGWGAQYSGWDFSGVSAEFRDLVETLMLHVCARLARCGVDADGFAADDEAQAQVTSISEDLHDLGSRFDDPVFVAAARLAASPQLGQLKAWLKKYTWAYSLWIDDPNLSATRSLLDAAVGDLPQVTPVSGLEFSHLAHALFLIGLRVADLSPGERRLLVRLSAKDVAFALDSAAAGYPVTPLILKVLEFAPPAAVARLRTYKSRPDR